MKTDPLLLPGKVYGISKNRCPIYSRIAVRNQQESVSALCRNHCPLYAGITVRNQQESVSALRRNHCPDWPGITVRIVQEYALISYLFNKITIIKLQSQVYVYFKKTVNYHMQVLLTHVGYVQKKLIDVEFDK